MAHEWGERPFDESRALKNIPVRRASEVALLAFHNGEAVGMLRGEVVRHWSESAPAAFAPLVWTRGVCADGGQVCPQVRERAALALVRRFLGWARENGHGTARAVFRAGMTPDAAALAETGLRREFRIFIRKSPLPGDAVSGRMRWFSTQARAARGEEMNLPYEKMFPELFLTGRDLPPASRRLELGDWDLALETVRASRRARGLPFSESDFRGLFRRAVLRPDHCALAVADENDEDDGGGGIGGIVIGAAVGHPLADGGISRAILLEWRGVGGKSARRMIWGLWRGFMFWSARRLSRAMLAVPPEGKFGDEFVRRCRLSPFGVCWRTEEALTAE